MKKYLILLAMVNYTVWAYADYATIINYSFESPAQIEGGYTYNGYSVDQFPFSDDAWQVSSGYMWGGVHNWQWADPDGSQHAFADLVDDGSADFEISQELPETALENTRYTLGFYLASGVPGIPYNFTGKMLIDGVEVASVSQDASFDGWTKFEAPAYESTADDAGKTITISLEFKDIQDDGQAAQVTFDYITLEFTDLSVEREKAHNPVPYNSRYMPASTNSVLSWQPGLSAESHNVYFGSDSEAVLNADVNSNEYKGNYLSAFYDPEETLTLGSAYYWRVDEIKGRDAVKGDLWSFRVNVDPGKASNPAPSDGAERINGIANILIENSSFEQPDLGVDGWTWDGVIPDWDVTGTLDGGLGYYVDTSNGNQAVWGYLASDGSGNVTITQTLSQEAQAGKRYSLSYTAWDDWYNENMSRITVSLMFDGAPVVTLTDNLAWHDFMQKTLPAYESTVTDAGKTISVAFFLENTGTQDTKFYLDDIALNNSDSNAALNWTAGKDAISHNVYYSTDYFDVKNASDPNSLPGRGNQSLTTYDLGQLLDGTYYWRIDELDSLGNIVKGDVWNFTACDYQGADYGLVPPDNLYTIKVSDMTDAECILAQSLAGIVAQDKPEIFLDYGVFNRMWLDDLVENYGIGCTNVIDVCDGTDPVEWLVEHFSGRLQGYLLYDLDDPDSVDATTSLAGITGGISVDVSLESAIESLGLAKIMDLRGKDEKWVYENYSSQFRDDCIMVQPEDYYRVGDWVAAAKMLNVYSSDKNWVEKVCAGITENYPHWGGYDKMFVDAGGNPEGGATNFVSENNGYWGGFEGTYNMSVYNAMNRFEPKIDFKQKIRDKRYTPVSGVHYVTFLISDMDNTSLVTDAEWYNRFYNNSHRGQFPIGWGVAPRMAKAAPTILEHYYRDATENDAFVCSYGMGFSYPSSIPSTTLNKHVQQLDLYMKKTDVRTVLLQDYPDVVDEAYFQNVLGKYANLKNVEGIFIENADYSAQWLNGKPLIPVTHFLWDGIGDPVSIAASINSASRDPETMDAYSVVFVHIWSNNLDDVSDTISRLNSDVHVVNPEEFVTQMYMNMVWNGDFNENGSYDINDLTVISDNWLRNYLTYQEGDMNGDKIVDLHDLAIFAEKWNYN
jgi:hypothetical protein